jgi:8-oxo-dGTP diphosphatase
MLLRRYQLVRLILQDGDRILLLRQTARNGKKFTLVGGKIQLRESPVEALVRETREECGAIVDPSDLEFVQCVYQRKSTLINTIWVFSCKRWSGEISNLEPHKFGGLGWFPSEELPENATKSTRHIVKQWKQGVPYSELHARKLKVK